MVARQEQQLPLRLAFVEIPLDSEGFLGCTLATPADGEIAGRELVCDLPSQYGTPD
jgi:hypothetical protein